MNAEVHAHQQTFRWLALFARRYAKRGVILLLCHLIGTTVLAQSDTIAVPQVERGKEESGRRASELCQQLPGYDSFKAEFAFGKTPYLGFINGFPESIYAWIHPTRPQLIDAVWWWDPIEKSGQPKFDWNQFRSAYEDASQKITPYSWLEEWKRAQRGRKIELHLFGTDIGEPDFQLKMSCLPAWEDAGCKGAPGYSFLLRRPDDSWIRIFFGRDEPRALVTDNFDSARDGQALHWLDQFDLAFHPSGKRAEKESKYLVVSVSGEYELKTYSKAAEGPPKKILPLSYAGGDGFSVEHAVIISGSDGGTLADAENAYLRKHFPHHHLVSSPQSLQLMSMDGTWYDVVTFRSWIAGRKREIYFEFSSFSGKRR